MISLNAAGPCAPACDPLATPPANPQGAVTGWIVGYGRHRHIPHRAGDRGLCGAYGGNTGEMALPTCKTCLRLENRASMPAWKVHADLKAARAVFANHPGANERRP